LEICLRINPNYLCDQATVNKNSYQLLTAVNHFCLLNTHEIIVAKSLDERVVNLAEAIPLQKFAGTNCFLRPLDQVNAYHGVNYFEDHTMLVF
jgi:hypothetical protein